jgi:hypothetical protein
MKQIKILILLVAGMAAFSSCRKSDNPKLPALTRFSNEPLLQKVAGTDQVISAQNPAAFTAKFTVDVYFKTEPPPQKFDVVVIKNGNIGNVKTLQANVTTFPSTITVTGAQLQTLFGAPIALGDKFDIGVNITANNGQQYEAFPATGAAYASGVSSQPGASPTVRYEAVCQYNPDDFQGNFIVVKDDWKDTNPGDIISFTKIDATHFSFIYPTAVNPKPIIVTVNPNTNVPSIAKQTIGTAWVYDNDPNPPTARTLAGTANNISPCDKTISLNMVWGEAGAEYGPYVFSLKKQ